MLSLSILIEVPRSLADYYEVDRLRIGSVLLYERGKNANRNRPRVEDAVANRAG